MKGLYNLVLIFLAVTVLFCAAGPAQLRAQQKDSAFISGTVLDPVGGAIPNATIVVRSESSGVETRATTDAAGKFSIFQSSARQLHRRSIRAGICPGQPTGCEAQPIARKIYRSR